MVHGEDGEEVPPLPALASPFMPPAFRPIRHLENEGLPNATRWRPNATHDPGGGNLFDGMQSCNLRLEDDMQHQRVYLSSPRVVWVDMIHFPAGYFAAVRASLHDALSARHQRLAPL